MKRYLSEFVYGATDGAVTTFAIIAGTIGANLNPVIILFLGVSNLFAAGFSMAVSNYLSKRSEDAQAQRAQTYLAPFKSGLATFAAFVVVGSIPLIPFVVAHVIPSLVPYQFGIAIAATSAAFLLIGAIRGKVSSQSQLFAAVETLIMGGAAALIAYNVGALIGKFVK